MSPIEDLAAARGIRLMTSHLRSGRRVSISEEQEAYLFLPEELEPWLDLLEELAEIMETPTEPIIFPTNQEEN